MWCGLVEDPELNLSIFAKTDAILAGKCLINLDQKISTETENLIIENLRKMLRDVQSGGEKRSFECVEVLSKFDNPPLQLVEDILNSIDKEVFGIIYECELSDVIAKFETRALPILLSKLSMKDYPRIYFIIRCLGKCKYPQIAPVLKHYCEFDHLRIYAYCALKHLGDENAESWLLDKENEKSGDDIKSIYSGLAFYGVSEIPFMVDILQIYGSNSRDGGSFKYHILKYIGEPAAQEIIWLLNIGEYSKETKEVLINTLVDLNKKEAVDILIKFTSDENANVRSCALWGIQKLDSSDSRVISSLYASLYDSDTQVVAQGIRYLLVSQFSDALLNFLTNNNREYQWQNYDGTMEGTGYSLSEISARRLCTIDSEFVQNSVLNWAKERLYIDGNTGDRDREKICDVAEEILKELNIPSANEVLQIYWDKK